jgi:predicted transcriptional regulator of viral defense system
MENHMTQQTDPRDLERRIHGEYREMPGLILTTAQACRLWHLDPATAEALLSRLVEKGTLARTREGAYRARPS